MYTTIALVILSFGTQIEASLCQFALVPIWKYLERAVPKECRQQPSVSSMKETI